MYNCPLTLVFIVFVCTYTTDAISCNGSAKYTLTFQAEWTSARHADFPSNPHFSAVVGCSHKADYVMWRPGEKASTGVKNVAELGSTYAINREMDGQITLKNAHKRYKGRVFFGGTNSDSVPDIEVNSEYPLVSFITMIAPSPDWFLGVRDLNLCDTTTGWQNQEVRDLFIYDAGTDSGLRFESSDKITNPRENIHRITNDTEGSLKGDKPIKRFGTFTFAKTSQSNATVTSSPSTPNTMTSSPSTEKTNAVTSSTSTEKTNMMTSLPSTENPNMVTSASSTSPSDTANPGTNNNITLLLLCILSITRYLI